MQGRNGSDQLNRFLIICGFVLWIVEMWVPSLWLSLAVWALLIWAFFRLLSRNLTARQSENYKFCTWLYRIRTGLRSLPLRFEEMREYRRFRCPNCMQKVRVPRGRGKVRVTCPRCGEKFAGRS